MSHESLSVGGPSLTEGTGFGVGDSALLLVAQHGLAAEADLSIFGVQEQFEADVRSEFTKCDMLSEGAGSTHNRSQQDV